MRVAMLVRCLAMMRGGGETRHLAWARELTAMGHDVEIFTGRPLVGRARYSVDGLNATVIRSPYARGFAYAVGRRRGFGRASMLALHADEEWFCRAAWRRIASRVPRPDIVHAHALHQAARLGRAGIPVVINLPGAPNPRYRELPEIGARELVTVLPLAAIVVVLGVYPHAVLDLVTASLLRLNDVVTAGAATGVALR